MLLLIFVILVVLFVLFCILTKYEVGNLDILWFIISVFLFITTIFIGYFICDQMYKIGTESILDKQIAMYEKENKAIEQYVDKTVMEYLNYEKTTLKELELDKDSMALATIIPRLNSNTIVQEQISIHISNKRLIATLKEK